MIYCRPAAIFLAALVLQPSPARTDPAKELAAYAYAEIGWADRHCIGVTTVSENVRGALGQVMDVWDAIDAPYDQIIHARENGLDQEYVRAGIAPVCSGLLDVYGPSGTSIPGLLSGNVDPDPTNSGITKSSRHLTADLTRFTSTDRFRIRIAFDKMNSRCLFLGGFGDQVHLVDVSVREPYHPIKFEGSETPWHRMVRFEYQVDQDPPSGFPRWAGHRFGIMIKDDFTEIVAEKSPGRHLCQIDEGVNGADIAARIP